MTDNSTGTTDWNGSIPSSFDARVLTLVVLVGGLAGSMNARYGGPLVAAGAFGTLVTAGVFGHVLGERRLRRLTNQLVRRWTEDGGSVEGVTRSTTGLRTEWIVHTRSGPVTIGGLALAPISTLTITWQGAKDAVPVTTAEKELERIADEFYREIFEFR